MNPIEKLPKCAILNNLILFLPSWMHQFHMKFFIYLYFRDREVRGAAYSAYTHLIYAPLISTPPFKYLCIYHSVNDGQMDEQTIADFELCWH